MIVVDTNVIAGLCILGPQTRGCERVRNKDSDWHSPYLWRSEFRNALAGYIRSGALSVGAALAIADDAEAMMRGREHDTDSASVLALIASSTCSTYDLEFVVLAQRLAVPLVTADRQILKEFPGVARSLLSF